MLNPRISLAFGCLCATLAASILAVTLPYYAIFASAALLITLITWIIVLGSASRRSQKHTPDRA